MFQYIRLRGNVCVMDNNYFNNEYVSINDIAQAKGLKSNRSIRLELNKPESKYIFREIKVNGGTSYEILFSSLEPELQNKFLYIISRSLSETLSGKRLILPRKTLRSAMYSVFIIIKFQVSNHIFL